MDITPLISSDQQVIQSYSAGRFKVSGVVHEKPIFVTPNLTIPWPFTKAAEELTIDDFEPLVQSGVQIDVILLGCGARSIFIRPDLRAALKEKGFAIDAMDTGAACRTYNVLMADGRLIAAALLPVKSSAAV